MPLAPQIHPVPSCGHAGVLWPYALF